MITRQHIKAQAFVSEFLTNGFNPAAAATKCGYKNASQAAWHLMKSPLVQEELKKWQKNNQKRTGITLDSLIIKANEIANFDLAYLYQEDGKTFKNIHDIPAEYRSAISYIETEDITAGFGPYTETIGVLKKVKAAEKTPAIALTAKLLGFVDGAVSGINVNVNVNGAQATKHVVEFEDCTEDIEHEEIDDSPKQIQ